MAKLIDRRMPNEINADDMKDGQIGIITSWIGEGYEGRVVQRVGNRLITLGRGSGNSWTTFFGGAPNGRCRVIVFAKGEQITLEIE